jgi:hypothetical protein
MDWPTDSLSPGTRIRLKANPAREGIIGNELDGSPSRPRVLEMFSDGIGEVLHPTVERKQIRYLHCD